MSAAAKILVFPRDANPYQELLYGAVRKAGARVRYLGQITPSRSANLLLLPVEIVGCRLAGWRVLHLHWVFGFSWPARHHPVSRRLSRWWFALVLAVCSLVRVRLVWTAHNLLPHEPVFDDDVVARRRLVAAAAAVIVHSAQAAEAIRQRFGEPRRLAVIPHGAFVAGPRQPRDDRTGPVRALFFGRISPYKGVEDLLRALAAERGNTSLRLTVAGLADDSDLGETLAALSAPLGERVDLMLGHVPDEDLAGLLAAHDVLVLPFRRAMTSGSVIAGLGAGLAVAVPDLPAFSGLPVIRFETGEAGLREGLRNLDGLGRAQLAELGRTAAAWVEDLPSWDEIARQTMEVLTAPAVSIERLER